MASDVHLDADSEAFIEEQMKTGQFDTPDDVVREALRDMKLRAEKLAALRAHVDQGAREADAGIFVEDFSFEKLIEETEAEENACIQDFANGRTGS